MSENKLPALDFLKLMDMFGEEAARETLDDVNSGRVPAENITKYLYQDESREEFDYRVKHE